MSKYQVGVTPYTTLEMVAGSSGVTAYLLCLDCGELWTDIAGRLDIIQLDHMLPCPAGRRARERDEKWRRENPNHISAFLSGMGMVVRDS